MAQVVASQRTSQHTPHVHQLMPLKRTLDWPYAHIHLLKRFMKPWLGIWARRCPIVAQRRWWPIWQLFWRHAMMRHPPNNPEDWTWPELWRKNPRGWSGNYFGAMMRHLSSNPDGWSRASSLPHRPCYPATSLFSISLIVDMAFWYTKRIVFYY